MAALRNNLNDSITDDDAAGMLSQHLITKPVFDALFGNSEFTARNPVSQVMQGVLAELENKGLESRPPSWRGSTRASGAASRALTTQQAASAW